MIRLPNRFKRKLDLGDSYYSAIVNVIGTQLGQFFDKNEMYFFEEYTDHGINHINSVLKAAENIITDDTYSLLSEKDITVLILAIYLHDIAMHIQPLTFKSIIEGEYDSTSSFFGDKSWPELWREYLLEAKKFNDQERLRIFGNVDIDIAEPVFSNPDMLNGSGKKLIGEFIRRHHPRIAFELAFKGFATHENRPLDIFTQFDKDLKFLVAIVARSHGIELRAVFPILQSQYDRSWSKPLGVHIFFLMGVLRLADYMQITADRILWVPYQTKLFSSPVSFEEHKKHIQTKHVQALDDDPETLFVLAEPESSLYFNALQKLFKSIQLEIDQTWAVLGQIYGSKSLTQQPKLKYRRIQSNLDNLQKFSATVKYVPEQISFSVDREIPKLLVGPLYGYNSSFGVRELIQNSVDACFERQFLEKSDKHKSLIFIDIEKRRSEFFFSISDNGKGMSLKEIKNYFLKVGGSFRKSSEWLINFTDKNNNSLVRRSGRFGIGVLAAYLLGEEIEVSTKSMDSQSGYTFKTKLENEYIEVSKVENLDVGTSIRIKISEKNYDDLIDSYSRFNDHYWHQESLPFNKWYTLKYPIIKYKINGKKLKGYASHVPGINDKISLEWNEIHHPEFKRILWSYKELDFDYEGRTICNGIVIPTKYDFSGIIQTSPTIVVYDFDAKLPISLNREFIASIFPFEEELKREIYKDLLAKLLVTPVGNVYKLNDCGVQRFFHKCFFSPERIFEDLQTLVYCKEGFFLKHHNFFEKFLGLKHLSILIDEHTQTHELIQILKYECSDIELISFIRIPNDYEEKNALLQEYRFFLSTASEVEFYQSTSRRFFQDFSGFSRTGVKPLRSLLSKEIGVIAAYLENIEGLIEPEDSLFSSVVNQYLGDNPVIPYDMKKRRRKFKKAFSDLSRYIQYHLSQM